MKSLREIVESSPQMRAVVMHSVRQEDEPQPLGPARWDWKSVRRVLVIRLRSIGDTVLATPSLYALRRFLPQAEIDILLEDWVAPVLDEFDCVDNIVTMQRASLASRASVARQLRAARYDVVYNLHGGTTATLLTRATGAKHRVGFAHYQYGRMHNHTAPSPLLLWRQPKTHSVEQQLALLGWTGIPVTDRPATRLVVTENSLTAVNGKLRTAGLSDATPFAMVHPTAAFDTKQWATDKFARVVEHLATCGLPTVAIAARNEAHVTDKLASGSSAPIIALTDLSLPEVTALASRARLFVGNDSGIAHIAAAVATPSVVIFGSSNVAHWRPWSTAPGEVVLEEMECQPCHGYFCEKFAQPECILRVPVARVTAAIDRVLRSL
jgi:predicted lipopolysaccharide heptosyltransferase III